MRKWEVIFLILLVLVGVGAGAYLFGVKQGENSAKGEWHDIGYSNAVKDNQIATEASETSFTSLQDDYNDLVDDYNQLRDAVKAVQYQPRQRLNCTSMTYGINDQFTSTNCY